MPLDPKAEDKFRELLVYRMMMEAGEALRLIIERYGAFMEPPEFARGKEQFEEGLVYGPEFINWMASRLSPPPAPESPPIPPADPTKEARETLERLLDFVGELETKHADPTYVSRNLVEGLILGELARIKKLQG